MVDKAVITRKADSIEEHLRRIRMLPLLSLPEFKEDIGVQDILLFNLIQAIQNCIDVAIHIVSDEGWGVPGTQREAFEILGNRDVIPAQLVEKLVSMVGFRNRVIHEYENLDLDIVYEVWQQRLGEVEKFAFAVMERYG